MHFNVPNPSPTSTTTVDSIFSSRSSLSTPRYYQPYPIQSAGDVGYVPFQLTQPSQRKPTKSSKLRVTWGSCPKPVRNEDPHPYTISNFGHVFRLSGAEDGTIAQRRVAAQEEAEADEERIAYFIHLHKIWKARYVENVHFRLVRYRSPRQPVSTAAKKGNVPTSPRTLPDWAQMSNEEREAREANATKARKRFVTMADVEMDWTGVEGEDENRYAELRDAEPQTSVAQRARWSA